MTYECKIVIKDRLMLKDEFDVFVKYREVGSFFFKKYSLIRHRPYCGSDLIQMLRLFNNMSMDDIRAMVARHIKLFNNERTHEKTGKDILKAEVERIKNKPKTFLVEVD